MFRSIFLSALVIVLIGSHAKAQQRIGVDVSSRLQNLVLTVHYQSVLKNRFLYSGGIFLGSAGNTLVRNDTIQLYGGTPIQSPFPNSPNSVNDTVTTYSLLDYRSSARIIGIQAGIGYYYEFGVQHGLRFNLNGRIGFASSTMGGYYRSIENFTEVYRPTYQNHFVGAVSAELYHTIRMSGRWTFNYGLKVPYYFSIDKSQFNPLSQKDLLNGFEPEVSIGLTRVIGKCD